MATPYSTCSIHHLTESNLEPLLNFSCLSAGIVFGREVHVLTSYFWQAQQHIDTIGERSRGLTNGDCITQEYIISPPGS